MDFNQVKDLIQLIDHSTISNFEIEFEHTKIRIEKTKSGVEQSTDLEKNTEDHLKEESNEPLTILPKQVVIEKEGNTIPSPLVGTFYQAVSPDQPPFVSVGSKVNKGDVLGIVEAMKIMNEITSVYDGVIAEIYVENEEMVEYGQELFRIV